MSLLHHPSPAVCGSHLLLSQTGYEPDSKWEVRKSPPSRLWCWHYGTCVCQAALRVSSTQQTPHWGDTGCIYLFLLGAGGSRLRSFWGGPDSGADPRSLFLEETHCRCVCVCVFMGEELQHNSCEIIILTLQHKFIVLLFYQATKEKLSKLSFLLFLTLNNRNFNRVYWLCEQGWVKTLI